MKLSTYLAVSGLALGALALPANAEIRIGASLAVTGPASFAGDPEAKTLEMIVEKINGAGGIDGEQIELIIYDDGADPNKARTFATRLVEDDEVVAIIGGTTTGATMSILSVAEEAGIPFISLAGAISIVDPVRSYVFKTPHTDRMGCQKIFTDMQARGVTGVGMISGTDGFSASMQAQCREVIGDFGLTLLADENYGPDDADMTPQLTRIKNTEGVQAILNPGFGKGSAIVTRNVRQLAIDLPYYVSHGVASSSFIELAGADAAEGARLPGTALLVDEILPEDDPQQPVVTAYAADYSEKYDLPISAFGGYAHDALYLLADAIDRADSTDPDAIRDALEATEGYVGVTGTYTFSAEDHLGLDLSAFRLVEIRDGDWVLAE